MAAAGRKTGDEIAPNKSCKKCKSVAQTGKKCLKCDTITHNSFVKLSRNIVFIENERIICCDNLLSGVLDSDNDIPSLGASDEFASSEKKVDVSIVDYMLKQKDIIIHGLWGKIDLLQKCIQLQSEINLFKMNSLSENNL
ncbi:hypothetical protein JTB14_017402 [Gonioctena quinquepunctata]|nr:hypothetical protein JTB14_017402 [Gonioctena quinquepunctata]